MKIEIIGGYKNAKQLIYDEALTDKKKDLKKIKIIQLDDISGLFAVTMLIIMSLLLLLSFISPLFFKGDNIYLSRILIVVFMLFALSIRLYEYKGEKNAQLQSISAQESMNVEKYIEYINSSSVLDLLFDDKWAGTQYDRLELINSALSPDVISTDYTFLRNERKIIAVILDKKDGQRDSFLLELDDIEYVDSNEDKLVWDNETITLYTNKNVKES